MGSSVEMRHQTSEYSSEAELLTRVASRYYLEGSTQTEIATAFNLSRAKVGRLLKRARENGIVEITVHTHPELNLQLENKLIALFGLKQALIANDHSNQEAQRLAVGQLVANYLDRVLLEGMTVAVCMGFSVSAVSNYSFQAMTRNCTFVPAVGGSSQADERINPNYICRRLAESMGGRSESLYAPAYEKDPAIRHSFFSSKTVGQTLSRAREANFALVGIGDVDDTATVVRAGYFSTEEMSALRHAGAVGDIIGYFFDLSGRPVMAETRDRVIGLNTDELRAIPNVIAMASEPNKTLSILGALQTGIIDVLATNVSSAQSVLDAYLTT